MLRKLHRLVSYRILAHIEQQSGVGAELEAGNSVQANVERKQLAPRGRLLALEGVPQAHGQSRRAGHGLMLAMGCWVMGAEPTEHGGIQKGRWRWRWACRRPAACGRSTASHASRCRWLLARLSPQPGIGGPCWQLSTSKAGTWRKVSSLTYTSAFPRPALLDALVQSQIR